MPYEPRAEYVIIGDAQDEASQAHALRAAHLRAALELLTDDACTFECDLPLDTDLPPDVRAAAGTLLAVSRPRARRRTPPATGVLTRSDPEVWRAFIRFAPYALDGSVWSRSDGRPLAFFADAGESVVLKLTQDQARRLTTLLAPTQLMLLRDFRAARHRDRHVQ